MLLCSTSVPSLRDNNICNKHENFVDLLARSKCVFFCVAFYVVKTKLTQTKFNTFLPYCCYSMKHNILSKLYSDCICETTAQI